MFGDFNEILKPEQRKNNKEGITSAMKNFIEWITMMKLT